MTDKRLIKQMFAELESKPLTESQRRFVGGAKKWFKKTRELSERQMQALNEIRQL